MNLAGVLLIVPLMLSAVFTVQTKPAEPPPATGFLYKTLKLEQETYAFSVFVPPNYSPEKTWPVILFLHGSGERGTDGFLQTEVGIGTAIRKSVDMFPAIIVMPQCRPNQMWVGPMSQMALRCLEHTAREYRLDPQRVYLTGLSLGGQAAWHLAAEYPDKFAAVVPVCGFAELGPDTGVAEKLAARLARVPLWAFHGARDQAVPVTKTRTLVELVRKAGGTCQFTEYPESGHNAWDQAYASRELWRWLFAQKLGSEPEKTQPPGK